MTGGGGPEIIVIQNSCQHNNPNKMKIEALSFQSGHKIPFELFDIRSLSSISSLTLLKGPHQSEMIASSLSNTPEGVPYQSQAPSASLSTNVRYTCKAREMRSDLKHTLTMSDCQHHGFL